MAIGLGAARCAGDFGWLQRGCVDTLRRGWVSCIVADDLTKPVDMSRCVFNCGRPWPGVGEKQDPNDPLIICEMNIDKDGNLHANQDHLNHAERRNVMAHIACYKAWYEQTYHSPFTMSG